MGTNQPLLSIIIATYNADLYIKHALDSIINQSFQNWECIIIDGLSTDKTIEIIERYMILDKRIKYISEQDLGIYDAFNKGWKKANGEWIYYLGADDILLKDGFKNIFLNSHINDKDIIYSNVIYRTPIGLNYVKSATNPDSIRKRLNCSHQGFIMRRKTILENKGFDIYNYRISADYDLVLRSYMNGGKMIYIDVDLSIFNVCGTSSTINMAIECFKIRHKLNAINFISNIILFLKEVILFYLRMIKYKISQ